MNVRGLFVKTATERAGRHESRASANQNTGAAILTNERRGKAGHLLTKSLTRLR